MSCNGQRARVTLVDSGETVPFVEEGVRVELSSDAQRSSADITKLAEVYIPYEWNDENIVKKISSFDPQNQQSYDLVDIEFQSVRSGEWTTVMRGFVRGISGTQQMGVARMFVSSPDTLLSAVAFGKRYERPNIEQVFNDVLTTFNQNTPFSAELSGVPSRDVEQKQDFIERTLSIGSLGLTDVLTDTVLPDVAAFKKNRHSLSDALSWATEISGHKYYFEVSEGGQLQLVYDDGSDVTTFTQRENRGTPQAQQLNDGGAFPNASSGEIDVISNTALAEIYPVNTLTVGSSQLKSQHLL